MSILMILDDVNTIKSIDKSDMNNVLFHFPDYITDAQRIVNETDLPKLYNIQQVIISGMGGSAISGDILRDYTEDKGFLPMMVYRSYQLPKWTNKHTLVFSQSYSGNTEETLSLFKHAYEKKCSIICITSGGKLQEYSKSRSIPCLILPCGFQPRSALAYLFFVGLFSLQKIGIFSNVIDKEIQETIDVTRHCIDTIIPSIQFDQNIAKQIANRIHSTIPQIYGWDIYQSVARRWATQINENSKMIAGYHSVPESNHNDIVGWSEHTEKSNLFSVLIFRDSHRETMRMKSRLDFMNTFYHQVAADTIEIQVQGKSNLAKMMYLLILGDYVSYYLAILRRKDPTPVSIINQLKHTLQRL
jgi:glucose/mannose-6-phosphate isomerase